VKKLLALTLLIIHFFNLAGYTFLFRYLGEQSSEQITRQIDQHNYNDAELVEIKVPLNLPYLTSWGEYERIDGEININGSHHNYVKRKIAGDTLYLLCLPNRQKDELQIAKSNFATQANDLGGTQDKQLVKKGIVFNQYQMEDIEYTIASTLHPGLRSYPIITSSLTDSFIDKHGRPPRS
jgi:hypothetical protein